MLLHGRRRARSTLRTIVRHQQGTAAATSSETNIKGLGFSSGVQLLPRNRSPRAISESFLTLQPLQHFSRASKQFKPYKFPGMTLRSRYLAAWAAAVLCLCWVTAATAAEAEGDVQPANQAGVPAHWKHNCGLLEVCDNPAACPIMRETPPEQFTVRFKTNMGTFRVRPRCSCPDLSSVLHAQNVVLGQSNILITAPAGTPTACVCSV